MTIKSLLLCLFLYVCLAWVGAAYFCQGPDILHYGLLWTAIGLIAVLAFIIGARLFGWWRLRRAKAAAQPAPAMKPVPSNHPDDVAMSVLIAEANAALAKAPSFAGRRGGATLSGMPLYLLIGPEGSGKTSTFLNSATEPQLLAGEGTAPVAPTRLCNLWLAKDAIFAEIGGRAFAAELSRWSQLLGVLRGQVAIPFWRRLWGEPERQMDLRGVIAFCDSKELTGASSDPQRLERYSRDWQERLRSIADRFGAEFPVYLVITKCDKIPFFSDFFRRLPESEVNQVLGCTLPAREAQTSRPHEVFVEAEAKRLAASFRPLYHALTRRRLTQLAHEPNPASRPGVYEFPRELKRIRSPLVQFLTDVFRPSSLGPSPVLRGYYLTGVRETELEIPDPAGRRMDTATQAPMEATRLFRGDATQIFQGADLSKGPGSGGRPALGLRWMFVADLFHRVILADQPPRKANPLDGRIEQYRKLAFGAVCGLCALLCLAFLVSWGNNRSLLYDIEAVASSQTNRQGRATSLQDLRALDALRVQVVKLQGHVPWRSRWFLYSGDRVLDQVRTAYFRQFHRLLLIDLNGQMMADLERLPANPDAGAPYDPAYRTLKTHLMITSGSCAVDSPFLSRQLKDVRARIAPDAGSEWQALADRQIDFYANELPRGNPLRLAEDIEGRERARQYLRQIKGIDRFYASILANAEKSLGKSSRLSELASNYTQVLSGPDEVSAAFSREGWAYLEKASREINAAARGEACVLGGASGLVADWKENIETAQAVQRMFLRDYVDHWRKFVEGFSVTKFTSAGDAARRLEILTDHKSPLLAVFAMTANHTSFPAPAAQTDAGVIQKGISKLTAPFKKAETETKAAVGAPAEAPDSLNTPADITPYFQPVQAVEPPGSETWVVDKNAAYIETLAQLRHSMQDIAQGASNPDPAVHQLARQNYDKAMDTVRQIARGFKPVGVGGLDTTVEHLLEEPILLTKPFIINDIRGIGVDQLNRDLRNFCTSEQNTLRKYPFKSSSTDDATLEEFASIFDPVKGAIWAFQRQSLADLAVKEGSLWKPKDPTKKPQVTQELLGFLNRAQSITEVFYGGGGTHMQFNYTLRPRLDSSLKEVTLELEIDGQPYQWTNNIQHQFNWPPPEGTKNPGAVARLRTTANVRVAFASRGGIWGIFRILGDAEPRDLDSKLVEWRYTSSGVGRREPIDPAPVHLEIVEPRGQDVFNPKFWDGLRCPSAAVQ
jgi:type VI secretion system protein ImpL